MLNECQWTQDSDGNWNTDCGYLFVFLANGPRENGMQFCCYCGKELIAVPFVEESDV
jgi:hypothetical protein